MHQNRSAFWPKNNTPTPAISHLWILFTEKSTAEFSQWPHRNFVWIVCGNLPKIVRLVKSCILPRWKMSSSYGYNIFLGWGRKQCKTTRTTFKVLRSHLLYGPLHKWVAANPELLQPKWVDVFISGPCWNYNKTPQALGFEKTIWNPTVQGVSRHESPQLFSAEFQCPNCSREYFIATQTAQ